MPIQLVSIGPATVITQNIIYALPSRLCVVTSTHALETSLDGSAWSAFSSGGTTGATFVRCLTANATITAKMVES